MGVFEAKKLIGIFKIQKNPMEKWFLAILKNLRLYLDLKKVRGKGWKACYRSIQDFFLRKMPNSPRKNCPALTSAIYHLESWTWVLTQFWNFEIISINKKVTASKSKVVFSFFGIFSKTPGWILDTLRGHIFFCMAMSYNLLNFSQIIDYDF